MNKYLIKPNGLISYINHSKMRNILLLIILLCSELYLFELQIKHDQWDYILFVQLWPPSWLIKSHIKRYEFNNTHFNLHGIWPQYYNGTWPQYCGNGLCFNQSIIEPIYNNLSTYWTDFRNPVKFWKHEFFKHLTCIDENPENGYKYFWYGLNMRTNFNLYTEFYNNQIIPSNNHNYPSLVIQNLLKKIYGIDTIVTCNDMGILEEIIYCIDKEFELFDCPKNIYHENCKNSVINYSVYNP